MHTVFWLHQDADVGGTGGRADSGGEREVTNMACACLASLMVLLLDCWVASQGAEEAALQLLNTKALDLHCAAFKVITLA